ncbi:MAG: hypothetical protein AB8B96_15360 [Lysobacterales bacterium]
MKSMNLRFTGAVIVLLLVFHGSAFAAGDAIFLFDRSGDKSPTEQAKTTEGKEGHQKTTPQKARGSSKNSAPRATGKRPGNTPRRLQDSPSSEPQNDVPEAQAAPSADPHQP